MTAKGARNKPSAEIRFPCLTFQQAGRTVVLFYASAKQLWSITEVNQRQEDRAKGYQRAVSLSRARQISHFIDDGNLIPTSVLISFSHARLSRDKSALIVKKRKNAGWIIDGQHRLAGGELADSDITLPVVAFTDLSLDDQVNCFVTINKEQKGVPSSLYLELLKKLPGHESLSDNAKERAVDLSHLLKTDELSPFFGRIVSTTSPKRGELSLTNFVRKVHPMLKQPGGRLLTYSDEERCGIIGNYYKGLRQVFQNEYERADSVFFRTLGFGALMGVLPTVLDIVTSETGGRFRVADVALLFKRIVHFDFTKWRGHSGSGAETQATQQLHAELMQNREAHHSSTGIELS